MPSQTFPASYMVAQLSPPPPLEMVFDYVCTNADTVGSGFSIENSRIANHRARGLLLKASHGLVRNVSITNSSLGGIIVTPELYWEEASYAHNVTLVGNTITLTSSGAQSYGGIGVGAVAPGDKLAVSPGHSGIVITNNTLVDCGYSPIWLNAAGNLTLSYNTLRSPFHASNASGLPHCCEPLPSSQAIAVYVSGVQGLSILGNCVFPAPGGENSLQYLLNVTDASGSWEGGVSFC